MVTNKAKQKLYGVLLLYCKRYTIFFFFFFFFFFFLGGGGGGGRGREGGHLRGSPYIKCDSE